MCIMLSDGTRMLSLDHVMHRITLTTAGFPSCVEDI